MTTITTKYSPLNDCIYLDTGIAKALKITRGIVASWLIQNSDDVFVVEVGSLNDIAQKTGIKSSTVSRSLSWLRKNGYIESVDNLSPEDARDLLRQKDASFFWGNESSGRCEWCESLALRLHGHHYPTPKAKGGEETVYICPNCHDEYHYLIDRMRYQLLPRLLDLRTISDEMMEELKK